ncbi:MAG: S-layer homology domain-containing protein [Oscillospiraceae bacterium]
MKRVLSLLLALVFVLSLAPVGVYAESEAWDGTVDISWYDPEKTEFELSTPAQLAGLAALVNGMVDPTCPEIIGDTGYLVSIPVDDVMLVGAGGGNVSDTVYTSGIDFAYKTVRLTADMDMGGVYDAATGTWSGPNWTPIGGKFPMLPEEAEGDCLTLDTRFNGVLDGQGHSIYNLYCDRYAQKGFPYSMAIGVVGYLGGVSDTDSYNETAVFSDGWQPAVRNLVLGSGSILGRRMVGGVVGRIAETNNGVIVENCANFATVHSTDSKGVGGIVGSAWGSGCIRSCYNAGNISTTYATPAGGICGTNEGMDIYNCYNVGYMDTNGQSRGRAIGSHESGVYTVDNCFYLEGTGDDATSPGYYMGISKRITVNVTGLSAGELKSAETLALLNQNGAVFQADVNGINNGYPVLWFQNGGSGTECSVTVAQPSSGGTVTADLSSGSFGTTVGLSFQAEPSYTLEHYLVNGKPILSDFFTLTENCTVSAVFKLLRTATITFPESRDFYVAVSRTGYTILDGEMEWVDGEMLHSGDLLVEGNCLRILTYAYPDASPEDLDTEYVDAFTAAVPGTVHNADGSYTVNGEGDVAISVSRTAQTKAWISLADTDWYSPGRSEYHISTAEELAGLAYLVNKSGVSFAGAVVYLDNDISLENTDGTVGIRTWTPIGSNMNKAFQGCLDGQGHAVYGLDIRTGSSYGGLFGCCKDAVIRNVELYGSVSSTAATAYAGSVAAWFSGGEIRSCASYVTVSASGTYAGGIAACLTGGAQVTDCFNYGSVTAASGLGGIAGISDSGEDAITGCANFGPVTSTGSGTYGTGGIVGRLAGLVEACVNTADVGGTDRYTGGIAGYTVGKNTSLIRLSANEGAVSSSNAMGTAGLGGMVGYAQFLTAESAENRGTVTPLSGFGGSSGDRIGREGTTGIREQTVEGEIPAYTPAAAREFETGTKSEYTVTFLADGRVVDTVSYRPGDASVEEPAVPRKAGYEGYWDHYALGEKDITVRAVYRQKLVAGGETVSESGSYFIAWFSTGVLTVAPNVTVTLDGSNGGREGFEELQIRVSEGGSLTLKNTVLNGEKTLLVFDGENSLSLEGRNELLSRAEASDNTQPAMRISGSLVIDGSGSLYARAGLRNTAVYVDAPGSVITLKGGEVAVFKDTLLGFEGGAFYANGSEIVLAGGTLKGYTDNDNVAVISADRLTVKGGRLLVRAGRCPLAVQAEVSASGGSIAAYGHTGFSAAFDAAYQGAEALSSFTGVTEWASFLPFEDVLVTDSCYDAVAWCYENGLFNGMSDTEFAPDGSMTRAMFVTVLYRLAGSPAQSTESVSFRDLTQDWYISAVAWASELGLTSGYSETVFAPDDPVTREQAAVFLCRYAEIFGDRFALTEEDTAHGPLSDWAREPVIWALSAGLFRGVTDAMAEPGSPAPRSLLASALANYCELVQ